MAPKNSLRALAAMLVLLATAETPGNTYVGVQGLAVVGFHQDVAGSQYGVGAGPLLQVQGGGRRVVLHLEGIPVVSIPNTRPSVAYGQATPALGIFNGQLEYAFDTRARFWAGIGETIYNQRTPLPAIAQVVSSRLVGVRYALRYDMPTRNSHFIEALAGVVPVMSGADVYVYSNGNPTVVKDERASEVDASLALGWRGKQTEWLFGVRTLNFASHFIATGLPADRNVGIGPMIEWRHIVH